jgi:hypothetical protein
MLSMITRSGDLRPGIPGCRRLEAVDQLSIDERFVTQHLAKLMILDLVVEPGKSASGATVRRVTVRRVADAVEPASSRLSDSRFD